MLLIQSQNTDYSTNINEIVNKITDHDHSNKYITSAEFDKFKD